MSPTQKTLLYTALVVFVATVAGNVAYAKGLKEKVEAPKK